MHGELSDEEKLGQVGIQPLCHACGRRKPGRRKIVTAHWDGAILFRARCRLGITRSDLAQMIDETPSTVRRWEVGLADPPDDKVAKMERFLRIRLILK